MNTITGWIGTGLGAVMNLCFRLTGNYGWAIILFTLVSKLILLPVSVWVHLNGLKMVRMMPEINYLHVKHYGDKDTISEEQAKLYKREKYSPLAGIIPVAIQLLILLGLVDVIRRLLSGGNGAEMNFLGINLGWVPSQRGGSSLLVPLAAGLSALLMCINQNIAQPLQSEQGKANQWGTLLFSVGLSLYLGFFVPAGIGVYWIASNLFSIIQVHLLNLAIPPEKHVDYEALEKSRQALREIEALDGDRKKSLLAHNEHAKREKADYRRFFSIENKHVVFYSEKSGFWKYLKDIVLELLKRSNLQVHYVTNDPNDQIFEIAKSEPRIIPYYIGPKKIITLMMKMDADIVVMTTPDLDNFHIKRSYVRKDIEYIYTPHDSMSMHFSFREDAFDHFDTLLLTGNQQVEEMRKREELFNLPKKNLIPCGYNMLDDLIEAWESREPEKEGRLKQILIAPSWNEGNLLDSCLEQLIRGLSAPDRKIIVRPHPEYVKRFSARLEAILSRWGNETGEHLEFETDFSSNRTIWESDLVITDWSAIANEFSYTTGRPTLFVNTKTQIKMLNPNWEKLGIEPLNISLRRQLGRTIEMEELGGINAVVTEMLENRDEWHDRIMKAREKNICNIGHAGETAAKYILTRLVTREPKEAGKDENRQ